MSRKLKIKSPHPLFSLPADAVVAGKGGQGGIISLICVFCLWYLVFNFSSAHAQEFTLRHNPQNIKSGYKVVSIIEENGSKHIKEEKIDLPYVVDTETSENPAMIKTQTADFASIAIRGLPIHLPKGPVAEKSTWDGWSEIDGVLIANYQYTLNGIREIAGRRCADISYTVRAVPKPEELSQTTNQSTPLNTAKNFTASGHLFYDINRGIVIIHTWEINGENKKIEYAMVLNI